MSSLTSLFVAAFLTCAACAGSATPALPAPPVPGAEPALAAPGAADDARPGAAASDHVGARLAGRVVNAVNAPVPGALVAVAVDGGQRAPVVVETDGDGAFAVAVEPASHYLVTATTRAGHAEVRASASGGKPAAVDLRLDSVAAGDGALEFEVVDDRGAPRGGQLVFFSGSTAPGWTWAARSDAAGIARVAVPDEGIAWFEDAAHRSVPTAYGPAVGAGDRIVVVARAALNAPPPTQLAAWVADAAAEVDGAAAALPPAVAAAVADADADIVGLGASSPGVGEYFALRALITRFLVARRGVRVVAWEAPWGAMLALDRYVRTGRGDPAAALAAMGWWSWDVVEARAFIDWLRAFNRGRPPTKRVHLVGVGAVRTRLETDAVVAAIRDCAPGRGAWAQAELAPLRDPRPKAEALILDVRGWKRYGAALTELTTLLSTRAARRCLGSPRAALVESTLLALRSAARSRRADLEQGPLAGRAARARAFADEVLAHADRLGDGRAVLWAHNDRVGRANVDGVGAAGRELASRLGSRYRPVGFAFGRGRFRAYDRRPGQPGDAVVPIEFPLPPAPCLATSLAAAVGDKQPVAVAVDLRRAPAGPVRSHLARVRRMHSLGGSYRGPAEPPLVAPSAAFDALVFVPAATPTTPTATGVRGPKRPAP